MNARPAANSPFVPARTRPTCIATSVEFGPGTRLANPISRAYSSSSIQPRRSTISCRMIEMCAAGPPNAVVPRRRKKSVTSRRRPGSVGTR
jgi:hypothetical protein